MRTMGTPLARAVRAMGTRAMSTERADVVVVGGGVAGAALACALRANPVTENLSVTAVDGNAIDARAPVEGADARCVALTPRSRAFLEHRCGGAWWAMEATGRAGAFSRMQAWDGVGGGHVSYDAGEMGSANLGHVVENSVVLEALERKMEALMPLVVATSRALDPILASWINTLLYRGCSFSCQTRRVNLGTV